MTIKEFKKLTKAELIEYGNKIPMGETRDKNGRLISSKHNNYWDEMTYDAQGRETSYIDSNGYGWEATYALTGGAVAFEDSDGVYEISNGAYAIKSVKVTKEEFDKFIKEQANEQ